jgi:hypothetical protein
MKWTPFSAMQRAWTVLTSRLHEELAPDAGWLAAGEQPIVAALCTCVLGERDDAHPGGWPPRSLAELSAQVPDSVDGLAGDAPLLEQGLDALDDLALRETGWNFSRLDRRTQLRSLFQLEAGLGSLSRRSASAFIDAFLTLAAQAYLRDALACPRPGFTHAQGRV